MGRFRQFVETDKHYELTPEFMKQTLSGPRPPNDNRYEFGTFLAKRNFNGLHAKFNPDGNMTPDFFYDEKKDILFVREIIGENQVVGSNDKTYHVPVEMIQPFVNKHYTQSQISRATNMRGNTVYGHPDNQPMIPRIEDIATGYYELLLPISNAKTRTEPELDRIIENFLLTSKKVKNEYRQALAQAYKQLNPGKGDEEEWTHAHHYLSHSPQQQWTSFQQAVSRAHEMAKQNNRSAYIVYGKTDWEVVATPPANKFSAYREIQPDGRVISHNAD